MAVTVTEGDDTVLAETVTVVADGMGERAVYRPPIETVPTEAFPPTTPFTAQPCNLMLVRLPIVNCTCWPALSV